MAQRVPGGLGSQICMTFGTGRWYGCQPHTPAAFTPRKCSWYSFSLGVESTPGPWYGRKEYITEKPVKPTGIDPGTFPLVPQRLNYYATPGPHIILYHSLSYHVYHIIYHIIYYIVSYHIISCSLVPPN